jgi:diadenosine tetraphosphate (Ap4A) HIT family hydrolase
MPCAFCALAADQAPGHRVYEDEATLAFLDRRPLAIGHCLLIPRAHVPTVFDADDATLAALALVPRRFGDKLFSGGMVWKRVRYENEAHREATAAKIRAAVG